MITYRMALLTLVWLGSVLPLPAAQPFSRTQSAPGSSAKVSGTISFRCLWWSDEQKRALDPNTPPPKSTEVTIDKWEYSDPIDVPHPDVVDVVYDLKNETAGPLNNLAVNFTARWQVGPLKNKKRAMWGNPIFLQRQEIAELEAQAVHTLRVPVKVAGKINQLFGAGSWPWTLQVRITVSDAAGRLLHKAQSDLPIVPGD
jgi:hypothetical protein